MGRLLRAAGRTWRGGCEDSRGERQEKWSERGVRSGILITFLHLLLLT